MLAENKNNIQVTCGRKPLFSNTSLRDAVPDRGAVFIRTDLRYGNVKSIDSYTTGRMTGEKNRCNLVEDEAQKLPGRQTCEDPILCRR